MFMSLDEIAVLEYGLKDTRSSTINMSHAESVRLCMNASLKGHPDALFDIGSYYFYGYSCMFEKNEKCALYLWKMAADKGHIGAQHALNNYYFYKNQLPPDEF